MKCHHMEPTFYTSFILLSIFLLFPSFYSSKPIPPSHCFEDDENALLEIKQHFNNDPNLFSTWVPGTDCCRWAGVLCSKVLKSTTQHKTTHRVSFLEINIFGIGTIPSLIGDLPYLETLFFLGNPNLTGTIPQSITRLTKLGIILMNDNNLSGPIPSFLSLLPNLTDLEFRNNSLSGVIPSSLNNLPSLTRLDFSDNQLTGTIPTNIGLLPKLTYLGLSNNKLSGPIPRSLGNRDFEILKLDGNQLTGDASFLFGENKTTLSNLKLGSNQLSFNLSNVVLPVGQSNSSIDELELSHNMIYGRVPDWIGEAPFLTALNISYNQLCGAIPPAVAKQVDPFGSPRFDSSMFEHNKCLCDAPLPPCKT